ncbi:MAG: hypothetical protein C0606_05475 [Hyphomicrobiales bacterium]|nr:MAG: hypothetical protein C0606_05475 [Hyphomicrobiales bacterium]
MSDQSNNADDRELRHLRRLIAEARALDGAEAPEARRRAVAILAELRPLRAALQNRRDALGSELAGMMGRLAAAASYRTIQNLSPIGRRPADKPPQSDGR